MADILDVTQPNEKHKQLLAYLMQQMQSAGAGDRGALNASASATPSARSSMASHSIFSRANPRGGGIDLTQLSKIPANLRSLLGPGGFGQANANEHSAAPGMPVVHPMQPSDMRTGAGAAGTLPVAAPPHPTPGGPPGMSPSLAAPANPISVADPHSNGSGFSIPEYAGPGIAAPANQIQTLANAASKPAVNKSGGGVFGLSGGIVQALLNAALSQMVPSDVNLSPHMASPDAQARGSMGSYQPL